MENENKNSLLWFGDEATPSCERIEIKNYAVEDELDQLKGAGSKDEFDGSLSRFLGVYTQFKHSWDENRRTFLEKAVSGKNISDFSSGEWELLKKALPRPRLVLEPNKALNDFFVCEIWIESPSYSNQVEQDERGAPSHLGIAVDLNLSDILEVLDRIAMGEPLLFEKQVRNLSAVNSYGNDIAGTVTTLTRDELEVFFEINESWERKLSFSDYAEKDSLIKLKSPFQALHEFDNDTRVKENKLSTLFD